MLESRLSASAGETLMCPVRRGVLMPPSQILPAVGRTWSCVSPAASLRCGPAATPSLDPCRDRRHKLFPRQPHGPLFERGKHGHAWLGPSLHPFEGCRSTHQTRRGQSPRFRGSGSRSPLVLFFAIAGAESRFRYQVPGRTPGGLASPATARRCCPSLQERAEMTSPSGLLLLLRLLEAAGRLICRVRPSRLYFQACIVQYWNVCACLILQAAGLD